VLYHLLAPLGKHLLLFNLVTYISFRAAAATVTAILIAFVIGPPVIARLRARKIGQVIRVEGPATHQGKRGTPTMGGVIILLATIVSTLLWAPLSNRFVLFAMLAPSGWAVSASWTTISRSSRGSPAGWWPSGSWRGR
jgi:phospho-N-acetylmuramoyl-pentapeptide-transferase